MKQNDLTTGSITKKLWLFALPLMAGNIMQQLYNLVDTWVVGKYIGSDALAAVGASYSFMTFLTSVILGLCLGSSVFFSICFGKKDFTSLKNGIFLSFILIGFISLILFLIAILFLDKIIFVLQVPVLIHEKMYTYLYYVLWGMFATFLYNYFASILRGIGNSFLSLIFLFISVVLNIVLDLYFVIVLKQGIKGVALATVLSQFVSAILLMIYFYAKYSQFHLKKEDCSFNKKNLKSILSLSLVTCMQQSVMNFGILLVQGIVNTFGASVMAAFAVAVKIDTLAYMPSQDFGNAFSTFIAQNFGAKKTDRIKKGIRISFSYVIIFCTVISIFIFAFAPIFMQLFVNKNEIEIISIGVKYLRIEGAFYFGIGILFLLYGYYRAINRPWISFLLTFASLGTRVLLSYVLSNFSSLGVIGIWISIPIGWALADVFGIVIYFTNIHKDDKIIL